MSAKNGLANLRTWVEVSRSAVRRNVSTFRRIIAPKAKLWAVVKSNAYGHGLVAFSKVADQYGVDGFCVDSLREALRLRTEGIRKPILVFGHTLPPLFSEAKNKNITLTVSNDAALRAIAKIKQPPLFHLKIDTGMHRQGFYVSGLGYIVRFFSSHPTVRAACSGVYTHFAAAKDMNYPTRTEEQFKAFLSALGRLKGAHGREFIRHCAVTGGTLMNPRYHLDAVRVGMGLYGFHPSHELRTQLPGVRLAPVLSWRTVVAEVKALKRGDFVGYDMTERITEPTRMAVLPIGYWHGFPRALSGVGAVAIRGSRARVLGRVSMDLLAVDVGTRSVKPGDTATIIGADGDVYMNAEDAALQAGTTHYEFLTRLNPLMERVIV